MDEDQAKKSIAIEAESIFASVFFTIFDSYKLQNVKKVVGVEMYTELTC